MKCRDATVFLPLHILLEQRTTPPLVVAATASRWAFAGADRVWFEREHTGQGTN
jgi:hypothetical protein